MTSKKPIGENKMKKRFVLFFLVSALTSISVFSQSNVVTIIPFVGQGISQGDADTFTEMFISEYARVTKSDIADRSNFDGIVAQHKFQLSEWSNDDKVAKLGKAMNAGKIICGRLSVFGYSITFTARILDVNSTKVLNSINWKGGSFDELLTGMANIAKDLGGMYYIGGKGPGGGIVFYESEVGFPVQEYDDTTVICHYLEVSQVEVMVTMWCNCMGYTPDGYVYSMCNVKTDEGLGSGKQNTRKLGNHSYAAEACAKYFTGTTKEGEWYLPSKTELNFIYENLIKTDILKSDKFYWSSSQSDVSEYQRVPAANNCFFLFYDYAWGQWFDNGRQEYHVKSGTQALKNGYVRAVRAF